MLRAGEEKLARGNARFVVLLSVPMCSPTLHKKSSGTYSCIWNLFTACSRSSLFFFFLFSRLSREKAKREERSFEARYDFASLIARGDAKGMKISSSGIEQPSSSWTDILRFFPPSRWRRIGSVIVCSKASYYGWTNGNGRVWTSDFTFFKIF